MEKKNHLWTKKKICFSREGKKKKKKKKRNRHQNKKNSGNEQGWTSTSVSSNKRRLHFTRQNLVCPPGSYFRSDQGKKKKKQCLLQSHFEFTHNIQHFPHSNRSTKLYAWILIDYHLIS